LRRGSSIVPDCLEKTVSGANGVMFLRKLAMMPRGPWVCVCVATLLLAPGCGKSDRPVMGSVEGVVTYAGQPLAGATVSFIPETAGDRAAGGTTDDSGRYRLTTFDPNDGAIVGKYRVTVTKREEAAAVKVPEGLSGAAAEEMQERANAVGKPLVPEKYFRPESSGLTAEVKPGSNTLDFALDEK
jgi:hypothetical protein